MAKLIDLTGQRFDKVIVIEKAQSRNRHVYWKCLCDCGNYCQISGQSLRKNISHDCGCRKQKKRKQKEQEKEKKKNKLVGLKFGKLTVIKLLDKTDKNFNKYWLCKCDCGQWCEATTVALTSKHKQSCGCLRRKDMTNQKFGKLTVIKVDPATVGTPGEVKWICKCDCGNFTSVKGYLLRAGNTQSCGCINYSIGEKNIQNVLKQNNISFVSQYTDFSLNRKRFDFAIIKNNKPIRLIEFDGQQHFNDLKGSWNSKETLQDRQKRDKQKNQWAKQHNIPLVRIPYTERDNITLDLILGDKYEIE